jgi:hypothetical protein
MKIWGSVAGLFSVMWIGCGGGTGSRDGSALIDSSIEEPSVVDASAEEAHADDGGPSDVDLPLDGQPADASDGGDAKSDGLDAPSEAGNPDAVDASDGGDAKSDGLDAPSEVGNPDAVDASDGGSDVGDGRPATPGATCNDARWCWVRPFPQGNDLFSTWATSANDVWAVGDWATVLHFDGKAWRVMKPPSINRGMAVWASSPTNAWAVFPPNAESLQTVIASWDGQQWTNRPTPLGNGFFPSSVWGTAPDDVWVVGSSSQAFHKTAFLHWNGSQWTEQDVDSSSPGSVTISGVARNDIWATSTTATYHYDGTTWTQAASPTDTPMINNFALPPIFAFAADDVWTGDRSFFRWNGQRWDVARAGASTDPFVVSIWGPASDDAWFLTNTLLHRDGTGTFTPFDPGTSATLRSITGSSSADVWAVGTGGTTVHFDGTEWSNVATDPFQLSSYLLTGVAGVSNDAFWVSGYEPGTVAYTTSGVVVRHSDAGWSELPRLTLQGSLAQLNAIWSNSPNDVWAAGTSGQIFQWDGTQWKASTPGTSANFSALWSDGPNDVWAVGGTGMRYDTGAIGTIAHYDGQQWSVTTGASLGAIGTDLGLATAVWGFGASDVWVTGTGGAVVHWDGQHWSESSKVAGGQAIWGMSPSDLWAGGAHLFRYDGASWTQMPSGQYVDSIAGRRSDDVFFTVGNGVWHWDGTALAFQPTPYTGSVGMKIWPAPTGQAWIVNGLNVFVQPAE